MITVTTGVLQKKIREYFQKIEDTGEDLIVTRDKVPVFKIVSLKNKPSVEDVFADVRGNVKYYKNILTPETEEWGAL
jgi:PHD/YefM family antitoxin component YafN of YafNO toxin-antitoxin module